MSSPGCSVWLQHHELLFLYLCCCCVECVAVRLVVTGDWSSLTVWTRRRPPERRLTAEELHTELPVFPQRSRKVLSRPAIKHNFVLQRQIHSESHSVSVAVLVTKAARPSAHLQPHSRSKFTWNLCPTGACLSRTPHRIEVTTPQPSLWSVEDEEEMKRRWRGEDIKSQRKLGYSMVMSRRWGGDGWRGESKMKMKMKRRWKWNKDEKILLMMFNPLMLFLCHSATVWPASVGRGRVIGAWPPLKVTSVANRHKLSWQLLITHCHVKHPQLAAKSLEKQRIWKSDAVAAAPSMATRGQWRHGARKHKSLCWKKRKVKKKKEEASAS